MPIIYFENLPVIAIDADGIGGCIASGTSKSRWRCSRSLWRKFLETEIRRLNEFEQAERRIARGKVLAFRKVVPDH